jgi:hypothetical protein
MKRGARISTGDAAKELAAGAQGARGGGSPPIAVDGVERAVFAHQIEALAKIGFEERRGKYGRCRCRSAFVDDGYVVATGVERRRFVAAARPNDEYARGWRLHVREQPEYHGRRPIFGWADA